MSSWSIAQANLTSVGVLAFIFGVFASRIKSDIRLPESIYGFLSVYLLLGIGLKGGHSLKSSPFSELLTPAIDTIICGALIPLLAFLILKLIYWNSFPLGTSPLIIGMFFMFGLILIFIGFCNIVSNWFIAVTLL